jgi:hypothetical protein
MSKVDRDKADRDKVDRDKITGEQNPKRAVGFAASPVLPGECQDEFDRLRDDLRDRYEPKGPVEEVAVDTMANAIWRKRHSNIFQRAFEARMKWDSYFAYPGEPNGFTRIRQATGELAVATMIQATTAFAMKRMEEKLGEGEAHDTEKTEENARLAKREIESTKETNANSASKDIPEGLLKRMVETAALEIKKASKACHGPLNSGREAEIVKGTVIDEWEREIATDKNDKPRSVREEIDQIYGALDRTMGAVEKLLGADTVVDICERIYRNYIEQELTKFGDLLTPERYIEELRFGELLDRTIECSHDRLMKYQTARAKKGAANNSSLQPGWAARRR